jgi:hypothetical protein
MKILFGDESGEEFLLKAMYSERNKSNNNSRLMLKNEEPKKETNSCVFKKTNEATIKE